MKAHLNLILKLNVNKQYLKFTHLIAHKTRKRVKLLRLTLSLLNNFSLFNSFNKINSNKEIYYIYYFHQPKELKWMKETESMTFESFIYHKFMRKIKMIEDKYVKIYFDMNLCLNIFTPF